jgi:hypothetical protein
MSVMDEDKGRRSLYLILLVCLFYYDSFAHRLPLIALALILLFYFWLLE